MNSKERARKSERERERITGLTINTSGRSTLTHTFHSRKEKCKVATLKSKDLSYVCVCYCSMTLLISKVIRTGLLGVPSVSVCVIVGQVRGRTCQDVSDLRGRQAMLVPMCVERDHLGIRYV